MAESGVILPVDSTGKATRTQTVTTTFTTGAGGVVHMPVSVIGDGTTSANTLSVDAAGRIVVFARPIDGSQNTYSAPALGATSNFAGDVMVLTGSASMVVRVLRVEISLSLSGTAITSGPNYIGLFTYSTATSGGTSSAAILGQYDSTDPAPTATAKVYSAAPTSGTLAAVVGMYGFTAAIGTFVNTWEFGTRPSHAVTLRGTSQQLSVNLHAAVAGTAPVATWRILIEWSEAAT